MQKQVELINILNQGQSRKTIDEAIIWIGSDPTNFKVLIEIITGNFDIQISNRAAWTLSYVAKNHPQLLKSYWGTFVKILVNKQTSNAIKRNVTRFMQDVEIPVKYHGKIIDRCFELVNNPQEDIAIRAFALTVLSNMVTLYPDLANELKLSIHELLPYASAGLKNRAKKVLKEIDLT